MGGPGTPVTPVELVPKLVGGDTPPTITSVTAIDANQRGFDEQRRVPSARDASDRPDPSERLERCLFEELQLTRTE